MGISVETKDPIQETVDPHKEYLRQHYLELARQLQAGEITPAQFAEIQTQNDLKLEAQRDYDGLVTDFLNNNGFSKALGKEILRAERENDSICLLALDVDHLKKFNDTMGHVKGDELLQLYANVISQCIRRTDLKGRVGGDEMAVCLIKSNLKNAQEIAERIRFSTLEAVKKAFPDFSQSQSVSIGIAEALAEDTATTLRTKADEALYLAKKERNKVCVYGKDELQEGEAASEPITTSPHPLPTTTNLS